MPHPLLDLFDGHQYLNIETFRKDGTGVRTPVWFVREGNTLYVWTQFDSGKAKRIRRNGKVRIAPCNARGDLLAEWIDAYAEADASPQVLKYVQELMGRKYGLAYRGFQLMGRLQKVRYTALRISIPAEKQ